ncbi:hypothetical protein [Runella slithyformis]|uniref:Class IIb bacteriocin, lactobin A/cerein 7B family n=1 Tax=Runella slithyformis (strain ATCC 29530 / DSM 19594 / LMG 11500 / NCIMB 11436 / LSU 4) TaxID=761193 RepID=A0A7U3ZKF7_RUNSL|nr:hypothetical protein [Runella slithyformis]AEI48867.1 hypothetical protein Runsl_2462 [Runella slithyformis DSM 19594]
MQNLQNYGVSELSFEEKNAMQGGLDPWTVAGVVIAAVMFADYVAKEFQTGQEIYQKAHHKH